MIWPLALLLAHVKGLRLLQAVGRCMPLTVTLTVRAPEGATVGAGQWLAVKYQAPFTFPVASQRLVSICSR